jgi:chromosome segregation ATPase
MANATKQVDAGIVLADRAGASLQEIVQTSQKVTHMVTQIAVANEEQSSTSEQISKNMEAIATVTQQTASGTQQIARAAEDLNRLTEALQQLVNQFKLTSQKERDVFSLSPQKSFEMKSRSKYTLKENSSLPTIHRNSAEK